MSGRYLTFDLGTTLYKVALFDDAGRMIALERAMPPIESPQPGWVEVDPKSFLRVIADAMARLRQRASLSDVVAVSIATQANSFVLTDENNKPVTPIILWSDQRAGPQDVAELHGVVGAKSPLLALAKLIWLRRHQPEVIARARRLIFIGDYLTRIGATERGVAAIARIYDPKKPIAEAECGHLVLEKLKLGHIELPHVRQAGTLLGPRELAPELGLREDVQLVLGCLDQYAGAIGTGTVKEGMVCETTGTVLAAVRLSDRFDQAAAADVFQGPAFAEGKFFQMSFSSTSANLLETYRNGLADRPTFEELSRLAELNQDPRGSEVRAIMQRVAEALQQQVRSLTRGQLPGEIRAAGGASKSDAWLKIKASTVGVPFVRMECEEPTSLGAAILAAHGVTGESIESIAGRWVRPAAVFR